MVGWDVAKGNVMIKEKVLAGVHRRPPQKWPTYDGRELDRTKFVTASEAAACERMIWYGKKYPKHKLERWGFAERGHSSEAWHVEQLKHSGAKVIMVGDQQASLYYGKLSGTPDGFMVLPEEHVLMEFKGIDPRAGRSKFPTARHTTQVQINMDLARKCLRWNVERAYILYTNAADYQDMLEFSVEYDPIVAEYHQARADIILNAESADELEPEGIHNGDCKFCDFRDKCSGAVMAAQMEKEKNKEALDAAAQLFKS